MLRVALRAERWQWVRVISIAGASIALCVLATGCMRFGPAFSEIESPSPSEAVVYVYTPWQFGGSGHLGWYLKVNDRLAAKMRVGTYYATQVHSGPVSLTLGKAGFSQAFSFGLLGGVMPGGASVTFDAKPGQTYYFRAPAARATVPTQIIQIDSESGRREIENTKAADTYD